MSSTTDKKRTEAPRRAGAFDIRTFIALLIGIYGVVLVIAGIIGPGDAALKKADGLNINLYAGIGMVVVAAVFLVWARLRPVVVPGHVDPGGSDEGRDRQDGRDGPAAGL